jgi:hypothetical protein
VKRPFPKHRSSTITRANIVVALAGNPDVTTPDEVAALLHGLPRLKPRHIARCTALFPQPEVSNVQDEIQ